MGKRIFHIKCVVFCMYNLGNFREQSKLLACKLVTTSIWDYLIVFICFQISMSKTQKSYFVLVQK